MSIHSFIKGPNPLSSIIEKKMPGKSASNFIIVFYLLHIILEDYNVIIMTKNHQKLKLSIGSFLTIPVGRLSKNPDRTGVNHGRW